MIGGDPYLLLDIPARDEVPRAIVRGLTIDSASSQDLDDAFWVERDGEGWRVDVSIADVAFYVPEGSDADRLAYTRVETRYHGRGNDPMLARELADDRCSLLPGVERPVIVTRLYFDADLGLVRVALAGGLLTSAARLSYVDVDKRLAGPGTDVIDEQIRLGQRIATALFKERRAHGGCAIYDLTSGLYVDEDGRLQRRTEEGFHAQMIIQELMIATNRAQATLAAGSGAPYLFRNHEATIAGPEPEALAQQVMTATQHPDQLAALAERLQLWMGRASYGTRLLGHYAVGAFAYTHATSPIRRYVDLVNQRQLRSGLTGRPVPYTRDQLDAIAEHVNGWHRQLDASRSQAMKAQEVRGLRQLASSASFASLPPAKFTPLLRQAIKDGRPGAALEEEIVARAQAGRLQPLDVFALAFEAAAGGTWQVARVAAARSLDACPGNAISALTIRKDRMRQAFTVVEAGAQPFEASVWAPTRDGHATTEPVKASTKKAAHAGAAVRWLQAFVDGSLLPAGEPPVLATAMAVDTALNPVCTLNEWCQRHGFPPAVYSVVATGPMHARKFTAVVTLVGVDVRGEAGEGSSKQDAKQEAARNLLATLRDHALTQMHQAARDMGARENIP